MVAVENVEERERGVCHLFAVYSQKSYYKKSDYNHSITSHQQAEQYYIAGLGTNNTMGE